MFLSAVLFVLFMAGCWLYCLTDAVLTPAAEVPGLRKPVWITAIAVTFILGAIAWIIARKWRRARHRPLRPAARPGLAGYDVLNVPEDPDRPASADRLTVAEALARHPASRSKNTPGRAAPIGPDDDPEFLRMLDRLISGTSDSSELARILTVCYTEPTGSTRPISPEKVPTWEDDRQLHRIRRATLGQVDYGVELVSTGGVPRDLQVQQLLGERQLTRLSARDQLALTPSSRRPRTSACR